MSGDLSLKSRSVCYFVGGEREFEEQLMPCTIRNGQKIWIPLNILVIVTNINLRLKYGHWACVISWWSHVGIRRAVNLPKLDIRDRVITGNDSDKIFPRFP